MGEYTRELREWWAVALLYLLSGPEMGGDSSLGLSALREQRVAEGPLAWSGPLCCSHTTFRK